MLFIDTSIFMYAAGSSHPLRDPCRRVLNLHEANELQAVTSAEVVQEILHRYRSIGNTKLAVGVASSVLDAFFPVLPITHNIAALATKLAEEGNSMPTRDFLHAATCVENRIEKIISTDRHFDQFDSVRRVDPADLATPAG